MLREYYPCEGGGKSTRIRYPGRKVRMKLQILLVVAALCLSLGAGAQSPPPGDPDLFIAITNHDLTRVKALAQQGARVSEPNSIGLTPLIWAALMGDEPICRALLDAKVDVNQPTRYGTALNYAEFSGNIGVVKLFFDHGAKLTNDRIDRITPLMTAAENDRAEMMRLFLRHKADV